MKTIVRAVPVLSSSVMAIAVAVTPFSAFAQQPTPAPTQPPATTTPPASTTPTQPPAAPQPTTAQPGEQAAMGRLEISTSDGVGQISVDGASVGEGAYMGDLAAGRHEVRVTRPGFRPYSKTVDLQAGQVFAETVTLTRLRGDETSELKTQHPLDGWYGGFQLMFATMPGGSGNSVEDSCDTLGATSCTGSMPIGGGLAGYVGYMFNPIGFELLAGALSDFARPSANFDGVHGSAINPLVAQPARDEAYLFARVGPIGALRARGSWTIDDFRVSVAAGVGLAYKSMWMKRTTTLTDGTPGEGEFAPEEATTYLSPAISVDLSGQLFISRTTTVALGVFMWAETAGDESRTVAASDEYFPGPGPLPIPLATPAYDLANGPQLYLGPFLGMHFGP